MKVLALQSAIHDACRGFRGGIGAERREYVWCRLLEWLYSPDLRIELRSLALQMLEVDSFGKQQGNPTEYIRVAAATQQAVMLSAGFLTRLTSPGLDYFHRYGVRRHSLQLYHIVALGDGSGATIEVPVGDTKNAAAIALCKHTCSIFLELAGRGKEYRPALKLLSVELAEAFVAVRPLFGLNQWGPTLMSAFLAEGPAVLHSKPMYCGIMTGFTKFIGRCPCDIVHAVAFFSDDQVVGQEQDKLKEMMVGGSGPSIDEKWNCYVCP